MVVLRKLKSSVPSSSASAPIGRWLRPRCPAAPWQACKQAYNSHVRQRRLAEAAPSVAASPKRLKSWQDKRAKEKAAEQERARALGRSSARPRRSFSAIRLPGRSALDKRRAVVSDESGLRPSLMHVPKKPTLFTGGRA
jgi:hypothetical protein